MDSLTCQAPLLPLYLPTSPLLSGVSTQGFFATLATQGIYSPLPTLSLAPSKGPPGNIIHGRTFTPNYPCTKDTVLGDKPLPGLPTQMVQKQIPAVLNLLRQMEEDMAKEVQRVTLAIQEARSLIVDYRRDQSDMKRGSI